jgi:hypothetical protein
MAMAESSRFAQRYLDKIVQLPVSLPFLPVHDAEAYLGLLLSRSSIDAVSDHRILRSGISQSRGWVGGLLAVG